MSKVGMGALLIVVFASGGAVGALLNDGGGPAGVPTPAPTVTETATVTVTKTRKIPTIPRACSKALESGRGMTKILDRYARLTKNVGQLFVNLYDTVAAAYNAGAAGNSHAATQNALDRLRARRDRVVAGSADLTREWRGASWRRLAKACEAAGE